MLTILTWLWQQPGGRIKYGPEHVDIWAAMVRRNLSMPHRLAVVTDIEADFGDVDVIRTPWEFTDVKLPGWGEKMPQCLRRLAMFRPDAAAIFGERFVSLDLDLVVYDSLDVLFDRSEDFVMYRGTFSDRPYNGSMLMMDAGARPSVYTQFDPVEAAAATRKFIGSDQAWISHVLGPGEATWGPEHGVYWRTTHGRQGGAAKERLVFFPGPTKPWDLLEDREIANRYHMSRGGRCLVLGYGAQVWAEAEAALESGTFDYIIASPEAAAHWPCSMINDVARSDYEADMRTRMMGFDETVFCGRSERIADHG